MSLEKNKEEIIEQREGIINLRRASNEKIKDTCLKFRKQCNIYGELDNEQFKKVIGDNLGDISEMSSKFIEQVKEGKMPWIPENFKRVNSTELPNIIGKHLEQADNPTFNAIFPILKGITYMTKTSQVMEWKNELMDKVLPGVEPSTYEYEKKIWKTVVERYGKAIYAKIDYMFNPEDMKLVLEQLELVVNSIILTGVKNIWESLRAMEAKDPWYSFLLKKEENTGEFNKRVVKRRRNEFNVVNTTKNALWVLEKDRIENTKEMSIEVNQIIISSHTNTTLQSKPENDENRLTGQYSTGSNLKSSILNPQSEINSSGPLPVYVQSKIVFNGYREEETGTTTLEPLKRVAQPNEYWIMTPPDEKYYDYSKEPSMKIMNFDSGSGVMSGVSTVKCHDNSNMFNKDGDIKGLDLQNNQKDFLHVGGIAIDYFGSMENSHKDGCTTEHYAKLTNSFHGYVLNKIGISKKEEIQLLSNVNPILEELKNTKGDEGDEDETDGYPVGYLGYQRLKDFATSTTLGKDLKDEKKVLKQWVSYLFKMATVITNLNKNGNTLFRSKLLANVGITDPRIIWINKVFFSDIVYKQNGGNGIWYGFLEKQFDTHVRLGPFVPAVSIVLAKPEVRKLETISDEEFWITDRDTNSNAKSTYSPSEKYSIDQSLIEKVKTQNKHIKEHIEAIKDNSDENTSNGPLLLTYLFFDFTKKNISTFLKNDIRIPLNYFLARNMLIDTDNVYWVERGKTLKRTEGVIRTNVVVQGLGQDMLWLIYLTLGTETDSPDSFYAAFSVCVKGFIRNNGTKFFDFEDFEMDDSENFFRRQLYDSDSSLYCIPIPPGVTYEDYEDSRYSTNGENIFYNSSKKNDNKKMIGADRLAHLIGEQIKWEAHDGIDGLYFKGAAIYKNGEYKTTGELFPDVYDGYVDYIVGKTKK